MIFLKSEVRCCNPFRDERATNKGESADFTAFDAKIGCHSNVPWAIEKRRSHR